MVLPPFAYVAIGAGVVAAVGGVYSYLKSKNEKEEGLGLEMKIAVPAEEYEKWRAENVPKTLPVAEILPAEEGSALPEAEEVQENGLTRLELAQPAQTITVSGPKAPTSVLKTTAQLAPPTATGVSLPGVGTFAQTGPVQSLATPLDDLYVKVIPRLKELEAEWPGLEELVLWLDMYDVPFIIDPEPFGLRDEFQVAGDPFFESEDDRHLLHEGFAVRLNPMLFKDLDGTTPAGQDKRRIHVDSEGDWYVWTGSDFIPVPILTWDIVKVEFFDGNEPEQRIGMAYGDSERVIYAIKTVTAETNPVGPTGTGMTIASALFPPLEPF